MKHGDHRHALFNFTGEKIDMLICQGQDSLYIGRIGNGLFDIFKRKEFLADDFAQVFGNLLLFLWKNTLRVKPRIFLGCRG